MIATVVGGRGSLYGPALAGLLLGVIRAEVVWFSSARWEETVSFLMLAAILFFKPHGLFGRKLRLEETA
jgi:branched-chain amino acid transport system permease protein